jgi:general L-amino acid transport system permease protein
MGTSRRVPAQPTDPLRVAWLWARANLFSSPGNTVLTIVTLAVIAFGLYGVLRFVFASAEWDVVTANRRLFFVGRFPEDELWRVWTVIFGMSLLAGFSWGLWSRITTVFAAILALSLIPVYLFLLSGEALFFTTLAIALFVAAYAAARYGVLVLRFPQTARSLTVLAWLFWFIIGIALLDGVDTRLWGGLLLTMILAVVGITASFPLGVLLAVGRASTFPVIRIFCVAYIELIRGVPLITILFMALFILPLMVEPERNISLPGVDIPVTGFNMEVVLRAMVGIILFSAAYLAEIVRGGLQAVPRSQVEAAQALGLGGLRILGLIVLPQALRAVIPAIVGQFISLFKDTSLVFILGLTDLLAVSRIVTAQNEFIGRQAEALLFVSLVYWVVAFSMSRASLRLERTLGVGER